MSNNCEDQSFGRVLGDAQVSSLKTNEILAAKKVSVCTNEPPFQEAGNVVTALTVTTTMFVDGEEVLPGPGGQGPPGADGVAGAPGVDGTIALAFPLPNSATFYSNEMTFDAHPGILLRGSDPLGASSTGYFDLGVAGVTTAWVNTNATAGSDWVDSSSGVMENKGAMVYVTEDYTETRRHSSTVSERDGMGTSVGYGTMKQTYNDLGGYTFGTYSTGDSGTPYKCILFRSQAALPFTPEYFVVRAIYLDNSNATTRVNFDFEKIPTTNSVDYILDRFSLVNVMF